MKGLLLMDSWKKIPVTEDMQKLISNITISNDYLDDMNVINQYINITQSLNKIYQWYRIFNYNYNRIRNLYPDGDIYVINSHVIALVSAGRNLTDAINNCANNTFNSNNEDEFKRNYISKEYDSHFPYRFMENMRNFTQHCEMPVSNHDEIPYFDLNQIYEASNFKFKANFKAEVKKIMDEISSLKGDTSKLAFLPTVLSYCCSVYRIFIAFTDEVKPSLAEKYSLIQQEIKEKPYLISHNNNPEIQGFIFYIVEDDRKDNSKNVDQLHCFNTNDNPLVAHEKIRKDCIGRYELSEENLVEIKKTLKPI